MIKKHSKHDTSSSQQRTNPSFNTRICCKREGEEGEEAHLPLVVHGNLNQDHGVGCVAELDVFSNGLPFVAPLGLAAEDLDKDDDDAHVHPLDEEHQRHYQAEEEAEFEERDNEGGLHLLPHQTQLLRHVIPAPLECLRQDVCGRQPIHFFSFLGLMKTMI